MNKLFFLFSLLIVFFFISCAGPYKVTREDNALERDEKVVLMDNDLQDDITITGLRRGRMQNGLLKVEAQIKNQTDSALAIQIKLRFQDKDKFFIEETNWMPVVLGHYEIYSFESNSLSDKPVDYTLSIRYAK